MHWDVHATCSIRTLKDEAYRDTIKQFGLDALKKLGYTELLTEAATAASLALCEEDVVGYASNFIKLVCNVLLIPSIYLNSNSDVCI